MISSVIDTLFPWSYVTMEKKTKLAGSTGSFQSRTYPCHRWENWGNVVTWLASSLSRLPKPHIGTVSWLKAGLQKKCLILIIPLPIPVPRASLMTPLSINPTFMPLKLWASFLCSEWVIHKEMQKFLVTLCFFFSLTASYGLECPPPENIQMVPSPNPSIPYVWST